MRSGKQYDFTMPKSTSFGVLLLNEHAQLLVAHVTGQKQWDIPKGGAEPGELPEESARRELLEETGIVLPAGVLTDLGLHPYTSSKDLYLFMAQVASGDHDIAACVCTSFFPHYHSGVLTPEVDEFRWIEKSEVPDFCTKNMATLVLRLLAEQLALREK